MRAERNPLRLINWSGNTSGKGPKISYLKFRMKEDWKRSWKAENTLPNVFPQNEKVTTDRKAWKTICNQPERAVVESTEQA